MDNIWHGACYCSYVYHCIVCGCPEKKGRVFAEFYAAWYNRCYFNFVINEVLAAQNFSTMVGINFWTALTSAMLGLPGVALLYGIHFLKIFVEDYQWTRGKRYTIIRLINHTD